MTREEIRDMARKRLGETTATFWTNTELNSWIDEAGDDLAFKTKSIKTNGTLTTTEDQQEYTLSTNFSTLVSITDVEYYQDGTTWVKIPATSREELNNLHKGWQSADSGTPQKYYWDREEDIIGFYPTPDGDNDGAYATVYYARTYTALATDASIPTLPSFLHMAMVYYVAAIGFGTRGYGDKENDMWTKYLGRIQEYLVERRIEREDDAPVMKSIYNI